MGLGGGGQAGFRRQWLQAVGDAGAVDLVDQLRDGVAFGAGRVGQER